MILQELYNYYTRKREEADSTMPPLGTSVEGIGFALVIGRDGTLHGIDDLREQEKQKLLPRKLAVPAAVTRTSGIKANFLWDKSSYVIGADSKGSVAEYQQRFQAFKELTEKVAREVDDDGLNAVCQFLERWEPTQAESTIARFQPWDEIAASNLAFRLDGEKGFIHDRPLVQRAWQAHLNDNNQAAQVSQCLISGDTDLPLARVHTPIKGVQGGQTSGGYIVSYNATAFVSYGKDKAEVAEGAAFAYTTALNFLLARGSRQKLAIGDTTLVFWAERQNLAEDFLADLLTPTDSLETEGEKEDDRITAGFIHDLLKALRKGSRVVDIVPDLDDSVRFFILGLAPNAARISIRFWLVDDLRRFLERIGTHFAQLAIIRQFDNEPEFPPLWRLLCQTAALGKSENVSPILAGAMIKAVLSGQRYPSSLLPAILGRIRAERRVDYLRASLLKAYLIRNHRMEVSMSLDPERSDIPYLLGRLFAVLEKAQTDAMPGTNATMKDRYFSSAPATPARVFPMLLKNSANHTAKLRKDPEKRGWAASIERNIQDIVDRLSIFPATLMAEDQGMFMIGYYQQMKDLYTSKKAGKDTNEEN